MRCIRALMLSCWVATSFWMLFCRARKVLICASSIGPNSGSAKYFWNVSGQTSSVLRSASAWSRTRIASKRASRRCSRRNSALGVVSSSTIRIWPDLDLVALAHLDLTNHATVRMLDDLVLAGGDEMARGHDGARQQRRARPGAECHQEDAEHNGAQLGRSPARPGNGLIEIRIRARHHHMPLRLAFEPVQDGAGIAGLVACLVSLAGDHRQDVIALAQRLDRAVVQHHDLVDAAQRAGRWVMATTVMPFFLARSSAAAQRQFAR